MHKALILLPLLFLLFYGCDERAAQFAKSADNLLQDYQKRIDSQLAVETGYYQNAASLLATESGRIGLESLEVERQERTTRLEADYREGRKPISLYRDDLLAYANDDFSQWKTWLSADVDSSAPYLQHIVALESDADTVDAFDKILKNLAAPRSVTTELKDLEQFVADSKQDFSKLVCDGISAKLAKTPPDDDEATTLKALQASQNCPTS